MKKEILNCLTYMANKTAETIAYGDSWGVEFCQKANQGSPQEDGGGASQAH